MKPKNQNIVVASVRVFLKHLKSFSWEENLALKMYREP